MSKNIPLSPIDHVFTGTGSYPIEFVFSYKAQIDEKKLLTSLNETLKIFPPIRSKLRKIDGTYWLEEGQNGCHFEVVNSNINFDETEKREIFIDPVATLEGEPLARIRLTQTPLGSVLGISISHCVADGFSYFFFLASWVSTFHRKSMLSPSHQRTLLIKDSAGENIVSSKELFKNTGLFLSEKRADINRDKLIWETIKISKEELKSLLEKAQKECTVRLSFNDVIVASLWKRYMEQWKTDTKDHQTFISCPFDYRRLIVNFPQTYFGNAVTLASTPLSYERLMNAKLSELAIIIRNSIASIDEKYVNDGLKTMALLTRDEGISVNEKIHVCHPENGLLVTNLSRLPVKDIEFNAGPPVKFEILTPANRGAVVLPGHDGIEVRVCCPF